MATMYKTPGVYIEEIPQFPPSIAPVETAIPAFVGYTQKADRSGESLVNKPTKIESIAEYELLFGGAPSQKVTLLLDTNNQFVRAVAEAELYLYDSLRLFYANGGGNCYIVSVGSYPGRGSVSSDTLEKAIDLLEQEDEPTIILAPDVVSDTNGPYEFQKKALAHCNKLMDRVTLCDLTKAVDSNAFESSVATFRDNIGINHLKYGAAYGPWIKANLPRTLLHRDVVLQRDGVGTTVQLSSLTADAELQSLIADLTNVENFVKEALIKKNTLSGDEHKSLDDRLKGLLDAFNAAALNATAAQMQAVLQPITDYMVAIVKEIKLRYGAAPDAANNRFKLKDNIDKYIAGSNLKTALETLANHHKFLTSLDAGKKIELVKSGAGTDLDAVAKFLGFADEATLLTPPPAAPDEVTKAYADAAKPNERGKVAVVPALAAANEAIAFFRFLETTQSNYEKTLNDALLTAFGLYKDLVTKAADALNVLPPSGAIAGIYAATDRDRGVWKAPANISLNAVVGPAVKISQYEQEAYNVDANAGKSINIIRAFTGKGTLVWGARTLAGNDNEWRYVSVRRFFNFAEESIKKATEQFVFEPNDANTWVRVQAMIENFLTVLWRQGALQGIKPEHAFYVAVGLGKTMTPLDILEGRMIIEIGMAVVRPAEFIILKFSHKMAES